jgi:hypothetical protein
MYKPIPMKIVNPEFYVLYNGKADYPEVSTVKLSDLFGIKGVENNLELTVTVINANKGYNKSMMERSKTLDEYAAFVAKVREYTDDNKLDLTESLKKAVEDCVKNNILREFLQKHGGEIVNILFREWNLDDALEAREEYRAEQIAENLLKDGMSKEIVAKYTKLTIVQVENVIKRINRKKS